MASTLTLAIESLKISLGRQNPFETLRIVDNIVQTFENDDTSSSGVSNHTAPEIDLSISKLFDAQQGMLTFLTRSIKCDKIHREANCKVLALFERILSGAHRQKCAEYAAAIVDVMLQFIRAGNVSAGEKERATVVLRTLVEQTLCARVPLNEVLSQVLLVSHNKNATGRFLQHIYELLGMLAHRYPECLQDGQDYAIRNMLLKTIESVLLTHQLAPFVALSGALRGLNHFLVNFAPIPSDEPDVCRRLYVCVHKLSDPPADFRKHDVYVASLDLLAAHATIVASHVFAEHAYWHAVLLRRLNETGDRTQRKSLFAALNAVHSVVAQTCESSQGDDDAAVAALETEALKFYIGHFKAVLLATASKPHEIRIAIRGLGLMAGACSRRWPAANLPEMLTLVLQRTESMGKTANHNSDQQLRRPTDLESYPDFVRALSQIMQHVRQLNNAQLSALQGILVALMRDFYYLPATYHGLTVSALLQTFANFVHVGAAAVDALMEQCVMRGLVWTCSHKLQLDSADDWDTQHDWKDHVTVASFMPMWLGLTSDERSSGAAQELDMMGEPSVLSTVADRREECAVATETDQIRKVKRQLYRYVLNALFVIVERVNLTLKPRSQSANADITAATDPSEPQYVADPQRDLEPVRAADFHLFFNVVQLFERLLAAQSNDAQHEVFAASAGRFCAVLARKCREHPLVSGFVRLMTAGLRILRRLQYFESGTLTDTATAQCVQRFVSVQLSRVAGLQGELQIACLMCMFAAPLPMLERGASAAADLAGAYRRAFAIGHAELYVAQTALRSLERLVANTTMTAAWLDDLLFNVLPSLDGYLMANGGCTSEMTGALQTTKSSGKTTSSGSRRMRRVVKMPESASETELLRFQKSVLMFLGTLSPHQCLHLIGTDASDPVDDAPPLTRPECSTSVRLTLHCGDIEPSIALDGLLPRIYTLSAQSADRPAKIAACELLHAVVLYLIGTRQFESAVWRTLCSHLLELGSDGDLAVRQMFEPLLDQIMHYMSHPAQLTDPAMRALLDCLFDGVAHPRAAAVRELAARALRTFVDWTVRQCAGVGSTVSDVGRVVREVLAQLQRHSYDSEPRRRRGAALAFNSVYRIVREQDGIVDEMWLDILRTVCINYQLSEYQQKQPNSAADDLQPVDAALDHVVRVLRERSAVFAVAPAGRVVPIGFAGATLGDAVGWLLAQCTVAPQMRFRRRCIGMVQQLAPLVPGSGGSLRTYLTGAESVADGLLAMCPVRQDLDRPTDVPRLLASLDFLIWIVGDALYADCDAMLRRSAIVPAVLRFLRSDLSTLSTDATQVNACTQRIIEFMLKLLPGHLAVFADCADWEQSVDSLTAIISGLVFAPHEWPDFDVPSNTVNAFIAQYAGAFPSPMADRIRSHFTSELMSRYAELVATTEMTMHSTVVPLAMLNSVRGISTLLASDGHRIDGVIEADGGQLLLQLFDGLSEQRIDGAYAHRLWPDVRSFANTTLRIALAVGAHSGSTTDGGPPMDRLMELVFDATSLIDADLGGAVCLHGQHFLNVFGSTVYAFLIRHADRAFVDIRRRLTPGTVLFVGDVCRDLVRHMERTQRHDRVALKACAVSVSSVVTQMIVLHAALDAPDDADGDDEAMDGRRSLGTSAAETTAVAYSILELVAHVTLIWPDPLIALGLQFDGLQAFIVQLIASRTATLELKARAIFLLPCHMDTLTEQHADIERALATLQELHFPLLSAEFAVGSLERGRFVAVLQALLDALVASRSPALLRFVIAATAADQRHILEADIRGALTQFSGRLGAVSAVNALAVLAVPFQMFGQQPQTMEPSIRLNVARRFLLPMLRSCGVEALVRFYGQHLGTILQWADANYGVGARGWAVEQALVTRIGAFRLVEVLAGVVSKERLQTDAVLLESLTVKPKSLIGMLTARTIATRSEIFVSDDPVASELFRQYNCATFSAICTLVANTQTELRFYERLLFKENPTKNEYIWRKIIDCRPSADYTRHLDAEFVELPHRRQRLVSIRGLLPIDGGSAALSDRLLAQSQNVYESSFSQDVSKIDLSHSTVRTDGQLHQQDRSSSSSNVGSAFVQLERDPINDHELMAVMCAVIRTMFDKGLTPVAEADAKCVPVAPTWARQLCAVLEDGTQPRNTRYFIAKLVDNCREHFVQYAPAMTGAVLAFLADECNVDDAALNVTGAADDRPRLNYFIIDMTVTLLEWNAVYTIQSVAERSAASTVLQFLMQNAWHERRDILRQRLEVVRSLFSAWSAHVQVPRQLLYDSLNRSPLPDSRANLCGLQLNAIVLSCSSDTRLLPWTQTALDAYVRCVLGNLDNQHAAIYQPAALLMGMVLARLSNGDHNDDDHPEMTTDHANPHHDALLAKLNRLRSAGAGEEKRFADILFAVHRHYPRIVVGFLLHIVNLIPKTVNVTLKRNYLSMFQAGMSVYGADVFRELVGIGLVDLLRSADHQVQALHCCNAALPHMSDAQTTAIWPELVTCWQSRDADARAIVAEMLLYVLQHSVDAALQRGAQTQLLRGFSDSDVRIRNRCFEFWSNCEHLPARLADRWLGVMDNLYDAGVEEHFLGYGAQLLLQVPVQSPRAKLAIFHQSIVAAAAALAPENATSAQLAEYQIDVSWSGRDSTMRAPLFVQSQQQRIEQRGGLLRATATDSQLAFEPTLEPSATPIGTGAAAAPFTLFSAASNGTQSAMLFALPDQMLDRRSQRVNQQPPQTDSQTKNTSGIYSRLRDRFLSNDATGFATETNRKWVDMARVRKSRQETTARNANRRRRAGGIQLYRRYRRGDFPDLFINNLAFLLPLQALAQLDRQLAGELFVSLHAAVASACAAEARRPFLLASSDAVHSILRQTQRCDPLVFGTLMQLATQHARHFDLPATLVATVATANRCMVPAIGYLERRLHHGWDTDGGPSSSAKSTTITRVDVEMKHWLKLTELYRALAESDVVAGIFAEKLDVDGWLPRALALEAAGDPESALRSYHECIQRGNVLETDFAYRSYFELLASMGDWKNLADACDGQLDNWDDVWTDEWRTETLLPHMMRARCRQVMRGDAVASGFVRQLEQWVRVPQRADHLNAYFGEELMMMHVAAGQWRTARVYGDRRLAAFLAEWPAVSVLTRKVRAELLLGIRTVAEMQASAELLLRSGNTSSGSDASAAAVEQLSGSEFTFAGLARRWQRDRPRRCDAPRLWDALIAYRACVAAAVPVASTAEAQRERLDDAVTASQFRLLALALDQRNVALSNRIVAMVPHRRNERRWLVMRAEHQSLKAGVLGRPTAAQIKLQLQAWDNVVKALADGANAEAEMEEPGARLEVLLRALQVGAGVAERLARVCDALTDGDMANWSAEIGQRIGNANLATVELVKEHLHGHAFRRLRERVQLFEDQPLRRDEASHNNQWFDGQDRGSVHFQLVAFCQARLTSTPAAASGDYVRTIVASLFQAMQFGSVPARQMFPCILDLPNLQRSEELQVAFNAHAAAVPAWMFLGWIPQMLSVFTFEEPCFLDALMLRIARAYPLAMFYTFRLTHEHRTETRRQRLDNDDDDEADARGAAAHWSPCVREMLAVLQNPAAEAFVQALLCLCVPEKKLHPHVLELYVEWNAYQPNEDDHDGIKTKRFMRTRMRQMMQKVWSPCQVRGRAYERLEAFRLELLELEKADDLYTALVSLSALIGRIQQATQTKVYKKDTLTTLSPWLAHFQWCGHDAAQHELELPDQYPQNVAPLAPPATASRAHIIKFDPNIQIFDTLRCPVRLRVCASDGRTHSYLMKYGEDIRQDQRIQQLLSLMQAQLSGDAQCRAHGLRLETYPVVPLSVHGGLLGWLDNTPDASTAVQAWLRRHYRPQAAGGRASTAAAPTDGGSQSITGDDAEDADNRQPHGDRVEALLRSARAEFERFIRAASGDDVPAPLQRNQHYYGRAAVRYTRQELVSAMRQLEYRIPVELLRGVLCDWAVSPQAFFALRANYASSLAALSVAHWLLGVGDRHLSNVLLNGRTGRVVGIDYGLAFGAGVRSHVPELVPFRLTPQFVQVLAPFGVCGALTAGMELALSCWRREHRVLDACMEVFVREPTIEWLESARNVDREAPEGGGRPAVQWEPEQRIAVARRKLRGANPRAVCSDDLGTGKVASSKEYLAAYRRLVAGQKTHNVRARLPDGGLTVAQQVQCLLDMATDPALLGVSYCGIQPWI